MGCPLTSRRQDREAWCIAGPKRRHRPTPARGSSSPSGSAGHFTSITLLRGRDVLVVAEDVLGVVLRLQRAQPPVLLSPIRPLDLLGTRVVAEVVHVGRAAA